MAKKVIVVLLELNKKHGAGEEYPEGWIGQLTGEKSDSGSVAEVKFGRHFLGKQAERGKRNVQKTDRNKCMFIPAWLLQQVLI